MAQRRPIDVTADGIPMARNYHVHWTANELVVNDERTLVCPMCKNPYAHGHIFQCPDGHLYCKACANLTRRRFCPNATCQRQVNKTQPIRNRHLEHILSDTNMVLETEAALTFDEVEDGGQGSTDGQQSGEGAVGSPYITGCCNMCNMMLPSSAARLKCLTCPNYMICVMCADMGKHVQHPLALLTTPETVMKANELFEHCVKNTQNQTEPKEKKKTVEQLRKEANDLRRKTNRRLRAARGFGAAFRPPRRVF